MNRSRDALVCKSSFVLHVELCLAIGLRPRAPETISDLQAVLHHPHADVRRYAQRWRPAEDVVERMPGLHRVVDQPATPDSILRRLSDSASRLLSRHHLAGSVA